VIVKGAHILEYLHRLHVSVDGGVEIVSIAFQNQAVLPYKTRLQEESSQCRASSTTMLTVLDTQYQLIRTRSSGLDPQNQAPSTNPSEPDPQNQTLRTNFTEPNPGTNPSEPEPQNQHLRTRYSVLALQNQILRTTPRSNPHRTRPLEPTPSTNRPEPNPQSQTLITRPLVPAPIDLPVDRGHSHL
ncbi:galectin-9-like isoform X1, partial [Tachysurus ichikawai]